MTNIIEEFQGDYRFLSNFWEAPIKYSVYVFPTSEHLYQSLKTDDLDDAMSIMQSATPHEAKKLGSSVSLREDWEEYKVTAMLQAVSSKFFQHPYLAYKLAATGDAHLQEGNRWHDNYWGVCLCDRKSCPPGENNLGKILMGLRSAITPWLDPQIIESYQRL